MPFELLIGKAFRATRTTLTARVSSPRSPSSALSPFFVWGGFPY